jgi:DNA-binding GntR family transcriptional regulator
MDDRAGEASSPPVDGSSARPTADRIRQALADDIVSGRLAPGMRLEEQSIADRFRVSRTPVREAFRQLDAAGLVRVRPRKGVIVTDIDLEELQELFEALASTEYMLARLAARRMSSMERLRLEQIHQACARAHESADHDRYAALNHDFHSLIYAGARNRHLQAIAENLRLRVRPFRSTSFRAGGRMESSMREHGAIVEAIAREDADAAAVALRAHIDSSSNNALRYFMRHRFGGGDQGAGEAAAIP